MVHELAQISSRIEVPEAEGVKHYVYHDAAHGAVCDVRGETQFNETLKGDELRHLSLRNLEGKEIDAFELLGLPEGVSVILDERQGPCYRRTTKTIYVQGIETPLQFVALAHEIGHAIQKSDPAYIALSEEYDSHKSNTPKDPFGAKTLEVVQKYVPDHGVILPAFEQLTALGRKYHELGVKSKKFREESAKEARRSMEMLSAYALAAMMKDFSEQVPVQQFLEQRGMKLLRASDRGRQGSARKIPESESLVMLAEILRNDFDTRKGIRCSGLREDGIFYIVLNVRNDQGGEFETVFTVDLSKSENPLAKAILSSMRRADEARRSGEEVQQGLRNIEKEYATIAEPYTEEIYQMLRIPTVTLERDATRRALVALRVLKQKHGIDFTQELAQTPDEVEELRRMKGQQSKHGDQTVLRNEGEDERGRSGAVAFLNTCLESTGSDNATNRESYGKPPRAIASISEESVNEV